MFVGNKLYIYRNCPNLCNFGYLDYTGIGSKLEAILEDNLQ